MSNNRDAFDYIAFALTLAVPVGLFAIGQLVRSIGNLRSRLDEIRDSLVDRIEKLERWKSAETGVP